MAWQTYELDRKAQQLVLNAKKRDVDSLNQAYKMRMAVAYGLERFWGEHLRLQQREPDKSKYWKETWDTLVTVMAKAGVTIPNDKIKNHDDKKKEEKSKRTIQEIEAMSEKLWSIPIEDQRVAIAVLTQLCDCLVWWTQRYKGKNDIRPDDE